MCTRWTLSLATSTLLVAAISAPLRAQDVPQLAEPESPSAELIIDAEEPIVAEPTTAPDDQALPPLDSSFPATDNFFGDDFFSQPEFVPQTDYVPETTIPERPPLIEDTKEIERKQRIQLRKIKAVLDRDPDLISLQEMADTASTPEDHRAARRAFYALFFQKVRKADPKLSDYADKLEARSLQDLYQTRIEPTLALTPPPQPQPQIQFIPKREFDTNE